MQIHPKGHEGQAPKEFGIDANILKTRRFNLAVARNLEEIEIGGSCLWAYTATSLNANIDVYINDQLRDPVSFQQGMFIRGIPFSRIYVSHAAQPGETITLFFAVEEDVRNIQIINPSSQFNNVNIGTITRDDSWFYDSMQQHAFMGGGSQTLAAAATHNCIQLWNPAASGFNLIVDGVSMITNAPMGDDCYLRSHNAALAVAGAVTNKWLTEPDGVALINLEPLAASPGVELVPFFTAANIDRKFTLKAPIIIEPGVGLVVEVDDALCSLSVVFDWIEVAV